MKTVKEQKTRRQQIWTAIALILFMGVASATCECTGDIVACYDFEIDYRDTCLNFNGTNNGASLDSGPDGQMLNLTGNVYVDLPTKFDPGVKNLTVCMWVEIDILDGSGEYILNNYQNPQWWMLQTLNDNNFTFRVDDGTTMETAEANLATGSWHKVCGVRNVTGDTVELWVNGSKVHSVTDDTDLGINATSNVDIGKSASAADKYFNGKVDNVLIVIGDLPTTAQMQNYSTYGNFSGGAPAGAASLSLAVQSPTNTTYYGGQTYVWANATTNINANCSRSLDGAANVSMANLTTTFSQNISGLALGTHNITFYCHSSTNSSDKQSVFREFILSNASVWNFTGITWDFYDEMNNTNCATITPTNNGKTWADSAPPPGCTEAGTVMDLDDDDGGNYEYKRIADLLGVGDINYTFHVKFKRGTGLAPDSATSFQFGNDNQQSTGLWVNSSHMCIRDSGNNFDCAIKALGTAQHWEFVCTYNAVTNTSSCHYDNYALPFASKVMLSTLANGYLYMWPARLANADVGNVSIDFIKVADQFWTASGGKPGSGAAGSGASTTLTLTRPKPRMVFQRNDTGYGAGYCLINITGTVDGSPDYIEARWGGAWMNLTDPIPVAGSFDTTLLISAGQNLLEVRVNNATSANDTEVNVSCGDVFVMAGQSNMVGRANNPQTHVGTYHAFAYDVDDVNWELANDPIHSDSNPGDGSMLPLFATYHMASQQVPTGFIAVSEGGTSILTWAGAGTTYYDRMITHIDEATYNTRNVAAILFYQGEQDQNQGVGRANGYDNYYGNLSLMLNNISADMPTGTKTFVGVTGGDFEEYQEAVRKAQMDSWLNFTNVGSGGTYYNVTANVHFETNAEITTFGMGFWNATAEQLGFGGTGVSPFFEKAITTNNKSVLIFWNDTMDNTLVPKMDCFNISNNSGIDWYLPVDISWYNATVLNVTAGATLTDMEISMGRKTYCAKENAPQDTNGLVANVFYNRTVTFGALAPPVGGDNGCTVALNTPANNSWTNLNTPSFTFTPTCYGSMPTKCYVTVEGLGAVGDNSSEIVNNTAETITMNTTITETLGLEWIVTCTNGTWSNASAMRIINVDRTNPWVTILGPTNSTVYNGSVNLNYTYTEANLSECRYSLNGAANVSVAVNNTLLTAANGTHTVILYCVDEAGNDNSSMVTFSIDNGSNQTGVLRVTAITSGGTVIDNWNCTVDGLTYSWKLINEPFYNVTDEFANGVIDTTKWTITNTTVGDGYVYAVEENGYLFTMGNTTVAGNRADHNITSINFLTANVTFQASAQASHADASSRVFFLLYNGSATHQFDLVGTGTETHTYILRYISSNTSYSVWIDGTYDNNYDVSGWTSMQVRIFGDAQGTGAATRRTQTNLTWFRLLVDYHTIDLNTSVHGVGANTLTVTAASHGGINYPSQAFSITLPNNVVTFQNITLLPNSLSLNVFQEVNTSQPIYNWNATFSNSTYSTTVTLQNNTYIKNGTASFPTGVITIRISASGYGTRNFYTTYTSSSTITVTAYLLGSGADVASVFLVQNANGDMLENAQISALRNVGGTWITMAQVQTDAAGTGTLLLDPTTTYRLTVSRTGYNTYTTNSFAPLATTYLITLTTNASQEIWQPSDLFYRKTTPSSSHSGNNITIEYIINDPYGLVDWANASVVLPNGTTIWTSNLTGSTSGGIISANVSDFGIPNGTDWFLFCTNTSRNGSFYSECKRFYTGASADGFAGSLENLRTGNILSTEALMMLALLITIAVTALVGTQFGWGTGAIAFIMCALFAMFSFWPGELYYLPAIAMILGVLAYFSRRMS